MVVGIARIAPGPFLQLGPGARSFKKTGDRRIVATALAAPKMAAPRGMRLALVHLVAPQPCVGVRSSWCPKASVHIHDSPTGEAVGQIFQSLLLFGDLIVHVAPIDHAFVKVVPFGLRRSFRETCCRITGHPRRIRFGGQSSTFLGDLGGNSSRSDRHAPNCDANQPNKRTSKFHAGKHRIP
jgi:hypothetical protein